MDLWTHIVCNKAANIWELEWNISHYSWPTPIHATTFLFLGRMEAESPVPTTAKFH